MVETGNIIFADGPSSSPSQPNKALIRAWMTWVEGIVSAFTTAGGLIYDNRGQLFADTGFTERRAAWVVDDPYVPYNGIYGFDPVTKIWSYKSRLPYDFIDARDAGAGTANAIAVTTGFPVSDGMVVMFSLYRDTTSSPVTLSINESAPFTVKTNRGNNASALTAGMEIWGRLRTSDNTFRLLNDQDVSALVGQAEAAKNAALAAAAGVSLPSVAANTMLVDNAAGTAREAKGLAYVVELLKTYSRFTLKGESAGTLADLFVLNTGNANTGQGIAPDAVANWLYVLQEVSSQGRIARFKLNGRRAQAAESVMNASSLIGHQGIAVDPSSKLWVSARGQDPNLYRGAYVPGGNFVPDTVGGVSLFKFFSDKPAAVGYGIPAISPDGTLLIVRCRVGSVNFMRKFLLSSIGGPGDYTGSQVETIPFVGNYTYQGFGASNEDIVTICGLGAPTNTGIEFRRFGIADGLEAEKPLILSETAMPWTVADGGGIITRAEPEGAAFYIPPGKNAARPMFLVSNGDTGDRVQRVFGLGIEAKQNAASYASEITSAFTTAASAAHARAIRETIFALVSSGVWNRLGGLYVFAARAADQRLVNWCDPSRGALTLINPGAIAVQDKVGVAGTGGGSGAYFQSSYLTYMSPNHYRDAAHAAVQVLTTAPTVGEVYGSEGGGWSRIYPRDGADNAQTRLMDSAASNNTSGVTDASGMWVINRSLRTEYQLWKNAALLSTIGQASEKSDSVSKRHQFLSNITTAQIAWGSFGYTLTDVDQANMKSIMDNLLASIAAL